MPAAPLLLFSVAVALAAVDYSGGLVPFYLRLVAMFTVFVLTADGAVQFGLATAVLPQAVGAHPRPGGTRRPLASTRTSPHESALPRFGAPPANHLGWFYGEGPGELTSHRFGPTRGDTRDEAPRWIQSVSDPVERDGLGASLISVRTVVTRLVNSGHLVARGPIERQRPLVRPMDRRSMARSHAQGPR